MDLFLYFSLPRWKGENSIPEAGQVSRRRECRGIKLFCFSPPHSAEQAGKAKINHVYHVNPPEADKSCQMSSVYTGRSL